MFYCFALLFLLCLIYCFTVSDLLFMCFYCFCGVWISVVCVCLCFLCVLHCVFYCLDLLFSFLLIENIVLLFLLFVAYCFHCFYCLYLWFLLLYCFCDFIVLIVSYSYNRLATKMCWGLYFCLYCEVVGRFLNGIVRCWGGFGMFFGGFWKVV